MPYWNVFFLDESGDEQMDCVIAESVIDACQKAHDRNIIYKIYKVELTPTSLEDLRSRTT